MNIHDLDILKYARLAHKKGTYALQGQCMLTQLLRWVSLEDFWKSTYKILCHLIILKLIHLLLLLGYACYMFIFRQCLLYFYF